MDVTCELTSKCFEDILLHVLSVITFTDDALRVITAHLHMMKTIWAKKKNHHVHVE